MKFDSDVRDPTLRRASTGPRAGPEGVREDGATPPTPGVPRRLARAHRGARGQVPAAARLVRLVDRAAARSKPDLQRFAAFYYNRGRRMGARAWRSTTRSTAASRSPTPPACSTSSADSSPTSARCSGRPTRRSRRTPGATSTNHDYKDSGLDRGRPGGHREQERQPAAQHRARGRTARFPSRRSRCCARSGEWLDVERRGDLRHAALGGLRRRADRGRRRARSPTRSARRSPPQDIRFTTQGRHALRDRARVARFRRIDHRLAGTRFAVAPAEVATVELLGARAVMTRDARAARMRPAPP